MMKPLLWLFGTAVWFSACTLREAVQVNANNSVNRTLDFTLDSAAIQQLVQLAGQQGQQGFSLDSMAIAWDSLTTSVRRHVEAVPGARARASTWNRKTLSGSMQFSLPNLDTYNQFAANTLSLPIELGSRVPVGGMKRQTLAWRGTDTLVIYLDNSRDSSLPAVSKAELQQVLGFMRTMMGLDVLVQYQVHFSLPRPAQSATGKGVVLSADKRTLSLAQPLDEPNAPGQPDEIVVVFE